ncbi:uncharacterized protein HD556DRAFT_1368074 [Suillus plorans]|uniref:Uncharacterized protein n=1 Tax=Suillus plorans TaxID=116603 RepID=A0A9P7AR89_9AGAM|nr:uncharacterized protein HD556DRAFT_1368074 [Suillus plorans]KAG1794561.1 hypothetical protein HD556DRAFT_1368074 [Suillus plorans]
MSAYVLTIGACQLCAYAADSNYGGSTCNRMMHDKFKSLIHHASDLSLERHHTGQTSKINQRYQGVEVQAPLQII